MGPQGPYHSEKNTHRLDFAEKPQIRELESSQPPNNTTDTTEGYGSTKINL